LISIFIIDDHPVVVTGLTALLKNFNEVKVAGSACNGIEAIQFLKSNTIDLVLLDINLPDISGIDLCKKINKEFQGIKILGISTFGERSYISRMIENGASGYLMKNASEAEIWEAIQTVMAGKLYLSISMEKSNNTYAEIPAITKREKEILSLISEGFTNHQIAGKLFISPLTVDSHRKNLLMKLNVNNTASLIRLAVSMNLV